MFAVLGMKDTHSPIIIVLEWFFSFL